MTRQTSLHGRLVRQFLLLALWPVPVLLLAGFGLVAPLLERQALERQHELAVALEEQVMLQLRQREVMVSLLATQVRDQLLSREGLAAALPALLRDDSFLQAAYLVSSQGRVTHAALPAASGRHAEDMIGADLSLREHMTRGMGAVRPAWSDTLLSTLTGRITAVLSVPAADGYLVVELSLDGLSRSIAEIAAGSAMRATVLDRQGRVIADADPQLALRQENLAGLGVVREAMRGATAHDRAEFDGQTHLVQAQPIKAIGWTILTRQPAAAVLEPVRRLNLVMLGLLLGAVPLASAAAWLVARRTGREVRQLADGAQRVVENHAEPPRLSFTTREFDAVWQRLRHLFEQLHLRDRQTDAARRDLQAVLDAATEVAVIATDTQGTVTVFNIGAQRMLGLAAADQIGRATPLVWHDADEIAQRVQAASLKHGMQLSPFDALVVEARHGGYEVRDWTYRCSDGQRIEVSLAITAVRDADGHLNGFLCVAVDVTQRRRAAELELSRRSAELASQAKSDFLSRMSHELRSPLNAMLGFAQLIEIDTRNPPSPVQRERVQHIQRAGWHLVQLIDDVLDLSRIESGNLRVSLEALPTASIVQHALDLVGGTARQQAVTLGLRADTARAGAAAMPAVIGDKTRLTQVLVNLLSNAVKYNRRGGSVEIGASVAGGRLLLTVRDTGRGMSAEQLRRLFNPFDRLGLEGSAIEGTGIGLVITRHLVELMHGTIEATSEAGAGTTFTVALPLAAAGSAPAATPQARPEPAPALVPAAPAAAAPAVTVTPQPRPRVLYIEDNEVNAQLMRAVFRQRPGVELCIARNIATGMEMLRERRPRLLLLDMHLPDGNGSDLLDAMAADAVLRQVPVVAVSADATWAQVQAAMGSGIRAYLTKPIDVREVLATVDRVLAAGAPEAGAGAAR